jgi:hypothetical protein
MPWMFGDLPPWLQSDIAAEREIEALALCMGKDLREGKATDKQMLAALHLAALEAPLDSERANILLYLVTKIMSARGTTIPDDIKVETLSQYEQGILVNDKITLYRRMGKAKTPLTDAINEVFGKPGKRKNPKEGSVIKKQEVKRPNALKERMIQCQETKQISIVAPERMVTLPVTPGQQCLMVD